MSKEESLEWAEKVKAQMKETFEVDGNTLDDYEFILFAGSKYYENLIDFIPNYSLPLGKLPIGKRLGALTVALKTNKPLEIGEK